MSPKLLMPVVVVLFTVVAMEAVATAVHRYVMHGFGWTWHRSHHRRNVRGLEKNDLYALIFAAFSIALFALGSTFRAAWWVGAGMMVYGVLYALLHDGLVHRRLPSPKAPARGYLKRLVQAHRLHHALEERDGTVSFGFLYAPPVARLRSKLRSRRFSP